MVDEIVRNDGLYVDFPNRGVVIIVPRQKISEPIRVKTRDTPNWTTMQATQDVFHAQSESINFEVVYNTDKQLDKFDPPIELKVYFTYQDLKLAAEENQIISLAYWGKKNDNPSNWIRFTKQKHNLRIRLIENSKWAGYFTVYIKDWGDPSVSVGR